MKELRQQPIISPLQGSVQHDFGHFEERLKAAMMKSPDPVDARDDFGLDSIGGVLIWAGSGGNCVSLATSVTGPGSALRSTSDHVPNVHAGNQHVNPIKKA